MSEDMKKVKQKRRGHWLLWWWINKDELHEQVDEYKTLKITQSARGISLLCLLFSAVITAIFIFTNQTGVDSFFDIFIFLVLGFFIYRGRQWAMIAAMLLWTCEKLFQIINHPSNSSIFVSAIIWWSIYMHAFYLAFRVERLRRKTLQSWDKN